MASYAEFLKSQGATEDEIKILDTPTARRAYDKLEDGVTRLAAERDQAKQGAVAYEERANKWFEEQNTKYQDLQKQLTTTTAKEAAARAAILKAQELGLIDVAKDLGYTPEAIVPPASPKPGADGFDPNKYFTREDILRIAESEGDAIAVAQNIAFEHTRLFPDRPLDFVAMRKKAVAAKKPVLQMWEEEYKVPDARAARDKAAHDKEIAEAVARGAKEKEAELVARFGNPDTRTLVPSTSPFAPRPTGTTRSGKQPWEVGTEDQLAADRVAHGTQAVLKSLAH